MRKDRSTPTSIKNPKSTIPSLSWFNQKKLRQKMGLAINPKPIK